MKRFLPLRSVIARLSMTLPMLLILALAPSLQLFAGGGFVPAQIYDGPLNLAQPAAQPLNNPVSLNDRQIPTTPTDPKVDIEVTVSITPEEINWLNSLDNDLPYHHRGLSEAAYQQQLLAADNILRPLTWQSNEPEAASSLENAEKHDVQSLKLLTCPNPSHGQFRATIEGSGTGLFTYRIVSLSGQVMESRNSASVFEDFDLSGNPAGIYYLQVMQGNTQLTARVLLQY